MAAYQSGETIRLAATITDSDGEAADPTTAKIAINDPSGTQVVTAVDMVNPEVGSYHYDYLIPNDIGAYNWQVTAVGSAGRITIVKDSFNVELSI